MSAPGIFQSGLNLEYSRPVSHMSGTRPGIDPDAGHGGHNFTATIFAHSATRSISKFLWTVHRAGHTSLTEKTVATHPAVEQNFLDESFDDADGTLHSLIADQQP